MNIKVSGSIALIVLFWASSFVAIKVGLQDISAMNLTLSRFLISSVTLAILAVFIKPSPMLKKDLVRFILASLSGVTLYNMALNYGQKTVSVGSASFLINTVPIFTTILSFILLKEGLKKRTVIGIFISTIGVGFITLSESVNFELNTGIILILLAALGQAFFYIIQKPLLTRYSPLTVISYSVWFGTLFLLPFSSDLSQLRYASLPSLSALLFLGVMVGAIGHVIWSFVLSKMSAASATSFLYFVPVVSMVLSFFMVGEVPSIMLIIGGVVAVLGVYIVNRKSTRTEYES